MKKLVTVEYEYLPNGDQHMTTDFESEEEANDPKLLAGAMTCFVDLLLKGNPKYFPDIIDSIKEYKVYFDSDQYAKDLKQYEEE